MPAPCREVDRLHAFVGQEVSYPGAAQCGKVCPAAERLAYVAGQGAYVCAFAAGYAYRYLGHVVFEELYLVDVQRFGLELYFFSAACEVV